MLFLFCLSLYAIFCVRPRKVAPLLKDLYQKNLLITGHFLNPNESLIPRLKGIFEEEGIPGEWVWLVEIESNFDHNANSDQGQRDFFSLCLKQPGVLVLKWIELMSV